MACEDVAEGIQRSRSDGRASVHVRVRDVQAAAQEARERAWSENLDCLVSSEEGGRVYVWAFDANERDWDSAWAISLVRDGGL